MIKNEILTKQAIKEIVILMRYNHTEPIYRIYGTEEKFILVNGQYVAI